MQESYLTPEWLTNEMTRRMPHAPTPSQSGALWALSRMVCTDKPRPTLLVNGFAGTGKTTIMRAFCDTMTSLHVPLVLMAPTGRAAKVLANATGMSAKTIHRTIYRQESASLGASFGANYNRLTHAIFVVDEASMIGNDSAGQSMTWGNGRLLSDLIDFVFASESNRLVMIGDPDQLPPIGVSQSPALDIDVLRSYGLTAGRVWLRDVVRQGAQSLILENASALRQIIDAEEPPTEIPELMAEDDTDVEKVPGEVLLEKLESAYNEFGVKNTVIITPSNWLATQYSIAIRAKALYIEERLTRGDLLIVTKNNYLWGERAGTDFIANGDIVEVVSINGYEEMHGLSFANVSVRLLDRDNVDIDCKVLLDMLTADVDMPNPTAPQLRLRRSSAEITKTLETAVEADYSDIGDARKRGTAMRKDEYLNALQVRYAYSLTCHKAQGGQWDAVFVALTGTGGQEQDVRERTKWIYTAITRASKRLYII